MLPIANKPMLLYGLDHLKNAGITNVGVILGPIKEGVVEVIGDGSRFGVRVTYIDQPNPLGLAHAVKVSKDFLGEEPFVMYLGDNLLRQGVGDFVQIFNRKKLDCVVGVASVKDPSRFGIAELDEKTGTIIRLVEKPKEPKSNLALIGVYVFGSAIFDAVNRIKPSGRNELEITDAIQVLVNDGRKVEVERVSGWWKDTGKPEDLLEANQLVLSDLKSFLGGEISDDSNITGNFSLGLRSKVRERVTIRGPAIVGENCEIGPNVYIGPYTSVGDECILKNVEIENSIVMKGSRVENNNRIVDSLIGAHSTILSSESVKPKGYKLILGERSFAQI
jgi:glucose-1-phosphate thymidylyltransferase